MDYIKSTWKTVILNKNVHIILNELTNNNIFPKYNDIFKCFNYFDIKETRVVILGQDPYHSPNQATGLCFGVNHKPPPSLKNIEKELLNDLNIKLSDYSLEKWAKQGILLLNSALTVIEGKPSSHIKLWNDFTNHIIEKLNEQENSIIFVAWGAFAHNKLINIDTQKHYLLVSSHPSPLSVYKKYKTYPAFYGSKPFSKINNILIENNKSIINW